MEVTQGSRDGQSFALGTFSRGNGAPFAGVIFNGDLVTSIDAIREICSRRGHKLPDSTSTLSLFENWSDTLPALQAAAEEIHAGTTSAARTVSACLVPMSSLTVHPPVASRQIFMSGANYFKHVVDIIVDLGPGKTPGTEGMDPERLRAYAEALMHRRKTDGAPYIFTKPVSVLSGAFDPIVLPSHATQPDWELELAVVIGAPARNVRKEDASRHIAGYTIANDITNRDWVWAREDMRPMGTDWVASKCSPTYLPIGPYIVPASQVGDPQSLRLELKLNGEVKQDESTSDMIFDVARLIEHVSSLVQLMPGDVICTGSPAGNGTHYNRFLRPGDLLECAITGLGCQRTPVVAERS